MGRAGKIGSQLVDEVFPRGLAVENRLLSSLTPDDRAAVTAARDLLIRAMLRQSPLSGDVDR